jgi:hypothetical protein
MEKEKEELGQKEFPFMDETPPTKLFPFMAEIESTDKKEKENGKRKN